MLKERQSVAGENIKGDKLEMVESIVSPTASHAPCSHLLIGMKP